MHGRQAHLDLAIAPGGLLVLAQMCPPTLRNGMPLLWMLPFGQGFRSRPGDGQNPAKRRCHDRDGLRLRRIAPSGRRAPPRGFSGKHPQFRPVLRDRHLRGVPGVSRGLPRTRAAPDERRPANELAVLTERARQSRIMHDSVLQALEGLAHAYVISACDTRKLAGIEAVRLRAMLTAAGGDPATSALLPQLRYVAREFSPLAIEIVELDARSYASQYPATPVPTIAAVGGAVREALNNVAKHASCAQVTVSITTAPDGALEVMVRDHGVGFDAAVVEHGFGLSNSVIKRVTRSAGAPTSGLALVPAPASPLLHRRRLDERPGRCTDNRYGTFAVGKLHDRVEAVPVDSIGAV